MKPAELIALYAPHGVDLEHVLGATSRTDGAGRKRRMGKEERRQAHGRPVTDTADGTASRVVRPRFWSHAETGMGACGVARLPWLAVCYSYGGDRDGYKELHRGLTLAAIHLAEAGSWGWQMPLLKQRVENGKTITETVRGYYLERLAELVLDYDGCRPAFIEPVIGPGGVAMYVSAPKRFAIYMGVTPDIWAKPLAGYFAELQERYEGWLAEGRGVIRGWLMDDLHRHSESDTVAAEPLNAA